MQVIVCIAKSPAAISPLRVCSILCAINWDNLIPWQGLTGSIIIPLGNASSYCYSQKGV